MEIPSNKILDKIWLRFSILFVLLLVLDRASKALALSYLEAGNRVDFGFELVYNDGILFGIDLPIWVIFLMSAFILGFGAYLSIKEKLWRDAWHLSALSLILAGAVGNIIDRVRFGYVVDFIKIYWWPNFNLADTWIVIGVMILLWSILVREEALVEL